MYKLDNWINEGSAWTIEYLNRGCTDISIYNPLSGSTHIELPAELKHSMKGLINIKSNDNKCFLWRHIRHLNPLNTNPQRITKADKTMANNLDYKGIDFPVSKKDCKKIENVCILL